LRCVGYVYVYVLRFTRLRLLHHVVYVLLLGDFICFTLLCVTYAFAVTFTRCCLRCLRLLFVYVTFTFVDLLYVAFPFYVRFTFVLICCCVGYVPHTFGYVRYTHSTRLPLPHVYVVTLRPVCYFTHGVTLHVGLLRLLRYTRLRYRYRSRCWLLLLRYVVAVVDLHVVRLVVYVVAVLRSVYHVWLRYFTFVTYGCCLRCLRCCVVGCVCYVTFYVTFTLLLHCVVCCIAVRCCSFVVVTGLLLLSLLLLLLICCCCCSVCCYVVTFGRYVRLLRYVTHTLLRCLRCYVVALRLRSRCCLIWLLRCCYVALITLHVALIYVLRVLLRYVYVVAFVVTLLIVDVLRFVTLFRCCVRCYVTFVVVTTLGCFTLRCCWLRFRLRFTLVTLYVTRFTFTLRCCLHVVVLLLRCCAFTLILRCLRCCLRYVCLRCCTFDLLFTLRCLLPLLRCCLLRFVVTFILLFPRLRWRLRLRFTFTFVTLRLRLRYVARLLRCLHYTLTRCYVVVYRVVTFTFVTVVTFALLRLRYITFGCWLLRCCLLLTLLLRCLPTLRSQFVVVDLIPVRCCFRCCCYVTGCCWLVTLRLLRLRTLYDVGCVYAFALLVTFVYVTRYVCYGVRWLFTVVAVALLRCVTLLHVCGYVCWLFTFAGSCFGWFVVTFVVTRLRCYVWLHVPCYVYVCCCYVVCFGCLIAVWFTLRFVYVTHTFTFCYTLPRWFALRWLVCGLVTGLVGYRLRLHVPRLVCSTVYVTLCC